MNNENLFNKVFKNKFLFNKILSFLDTKFQINKFKYDQLVSVNLMLQLGLIELFKYKVMKNEYLTFGNIESEYTIEEYQIFTNKLPNDYKIKTNLKNKLHFLAIFYFITNENDQNFYRLLFKNYDFHFFKEVDNFKEKEFISILINLDCLGALIALIQDFNLVIKESHFLMAFENNSFKILNYLYLNYRKYKPSNIKLLNIIINCLPLKKEYLNQDSSRYIRCKQINGKINFLINFLKLSKSEIEFKQSIFTFEEDLFNLTIQDLLQSCYSISFLEDSTNCKFSKLLIKMNQDYLIINNSNDKELFEIYLNEFSNFKILKINEIDEIKKKIPINQLSIKLISLPIEFNQLIKPLIKMAIIFIGTSKDYFFKSFIFYLIRFSINSLENLKLSKSSNYCNNSILKFIEYSQDSNEIKIKFLKNLFDYQLSFNLIELIKMVIKLQNIEILDFILISNKNQIETHNLRISNILANVETIEMFNYLYNNFASSVNQDSNLTLFFNTNYKIIQFYKLQYPIVYNQLLNQQSNELISFIECKQSIFERKVQFLIDNPIFYINNSDKFNQRSIIPIELVNIDFTKYQIYQLISFSNHWSSMTYRLAFKSDFNIKDILLTFNYFNNIDYLNDTQVTPLYFFTNSKFLFSLIGQFSYIQSLSNILSKYFTNENENLEFIKYLDILFNWASFYGQLQVFDFVKKNYPHLYLKENSKIKKNCIQNSKLNYHVLLEQFFKQ